MLKLVDVEKSYGRKKALRKLSFEVNTGEIYGLVGTDQSGKTTVCRILAGIVFKDSGSVFLDGMEYGRNTRKQYQSIGYLPDHNGIYEKLTVEEYLYYFAALYGVTGRKVKKQCDELLDQVGLNMLRDHMASKLAIAQRQRLSLARCLIADPKLLVLDEPFAELDAVSRAELMGVLSDVATSGITILLSSHHLQEPSRLCDRIGIMDEGKLVIQGTVEEIMQQKKQSNPILIQVADGIETAIMILQEAPEVTSLTKDANLLSVIFRGQEEEEACLLTELINRGVKITAFYREESDLESLYLRITQR